MMKKIIYLLFFVIASNIKMYAQEKPNVIITGKLFNKIHLSAKIHSDNAALMLPTEIYAKINPDSTFTIQFHISKPMPVTLINQTIFCEPGDSVHVLISGKLPWPKMEFKGDKDTIYNFFPHFFELESKSRKEMHKEFLETPDENRFLIPYKNKLYEDYSKKKDFVISYFGKIPLSKAYKDFVYSKMYYSYLSGLLAKYQRVKDADEQTLLDYFKGITPAELQNEEFISISEYSVCLFYYSINYWAKADPNTSITTTIKKQFDFVKREFKGNTRDILLARLFKRYFEKGNPEYYDFISKEYQESKQNFFRKDYFERLIPYYTRYMMFELDLSQDTKTLVRKISGEQESIAKVMQSLKGNVVYLDLWASWCGPCRSEMPHSEKLLKTYSGKTVKFIYLSTDDKTEAWKEAFSELKMDDSNSFLLDNSTKESFKKSINLQGIPRYILIDKNGKIVDGDAPRPSEERLIGLINRYLE